jgi:hypothetical protein
MTETNHLFGGEADPSDDRTPLLTPEELEIIGYFACGHKYAVSSQNLKLEYTETSIRLSNGNGKLLGISKQVNQWQRKVLISHSYACRSAIVQALIGLGFIEKQKSSHPEFTEYHHYTIPVGYKLNYTEAIQLWKVWWNNKRYQLNTPHPSIDILTFTKADWRLVQDLQPKQGNFILRTERGEIKIEPEEYVVWIDSILMMPPENSAPKSTSSVSAISPAQQRKSSSNPSVRLDSSSGTESTAAETSRSAIRFSSPAATPIMVQLAGSPENVDRNIISHKAYVDRLPEPEEDIDLESYLSTFNTEDTEDIDRIEGIYNIGELLSANDAIEDFAPSSPPSRSSIRASLVAETTVPESIAFVPTDLEQPVSTPLPTQSSLSLLQRQASLKQQAMSVLAKYLQEGDRIVRTEVLKNAHGEETNRKVTKIQRGCPSWAIDQIKQLKQ